MRCGQSVGTCGFSVVSTFILEMKQTKIGLSMLGFSLWKVVLLHTARPLDQLKQDHRSLRSVPLKWHICLLASSLFSGLICNLSLSENMLLAFKSTFAG